MTTTMNACRHRRRRRLGEERIPSHVHAPLFCFILFGSRQQRPLRTLIDRFFPLTEHLFRLVPANSTDTPFFFFLLCLSSFIAVNPLHIMTHDHTSLRPMSTTQAECEWTEWVHQSYLDQLTPSFDDVTDVDVDVIGVRALESFNAHLPRSTAS